MESYNELTKYGKDELIAKYWAIYELYEELTQKYMQLSEQYAKLEAKAEMMCKPVGQSKPKGKAKIIHLKTK